MKRFAYLLSLFLLVVTFFACVTVWETTQISTGKIPVDSTVQHLANREYIAALAPVKVQIDKNLNIVIGQAAETMTVGRPESLLSNLTSKVLREAASQYTGTAVDIGIMNLGGLRTQLGKGNITVRNIFELMPFENELVVLWISGDTLLRFFDEFALQGGQGEDGFTMEIAGKKPQNILIGGQPLEPQKIYTVATNDYLAGGNDKLYHLAAFQKRQNTGLSVRDIFINYIKEKTAKGEQITSLTDGRVKLINH